MDLLYTSSEKYLLEKHANERSVAFRLGLYLQKWLDSEYGSDKYAVDAEYNVSHGNTPKRVYEKCIHCRKCDVSNSRKGEEKKLKEIDEISSKYDLNFTQYIYPDLIVHKRDLRQNYIIIELKNKRNGKGRISDDVKLKYLTCKKAEYQYDFGMFIDFDDKGYNIDLYQDAKYERNKFHGPQRK